MLQFPDSVMAMNLKACNAFKLFDGKAADAELKALVDRLHATSGDLDSDLLKHNLVVFRSGENALQVCIASTRGAEAARLTVLRTYRCSRRS